VQALCATLFVDRTRVMHALAPTWEDRRWSGKHAPSLIEVVIVLVVIAIVSAVVVADHNPPRICSHR
jgi:hypothetical protein